VKTFKPTRRAALKAAAVLTATPAVAKAQTGGSGPANRDLVLWYRQPAAQWVEALPVGNGRIGAMVFGGVEHERLQLNENSLWAGGPYDPANPEALAALPEVRRLVFAGEYEKATELVAAKMMATPIRQMSYQTVGDLRLDFPGLGAVSNYRRSLDLDGAVAETRFTAGGATFQREVFATGVDQVLAVRLTCDKPGRINLDATFHWPLKTLPTPPADAPPAPAPATTMRTEGPVLTGFDPATPRPADTAIAVESGGDLVMTARNAAQNGVAGALAYEARARLSHTGGTVTREGGSIRVRGADSVTILVAMATSYKNFRITDGDPAALNRAALAKASAKPFISLLVDHQADYRRLFHRVAVDFGRTPAADLPTDERVKTSRTSNDPALAALYYQFGRYLLISCSRPGGQPANLQGLWNDRNNPPWGGKYTININTEMNYWPAEPTALSECVEPLVEMVRDLSVTGAHTAKVMYGAKGWVTHHNTDLWRASGPIDGAKYGMWPTGGAWLCLHLWDHYDYGRDKAYLAGIYPVLKSASEFFLDALVEHPNGKWLVTNPSMSPENMHRPSISIAPGPTMDNQILRDLFANTMQASEILGLDAELRARIKATRDRLPPHQIGKQGQLQEWLEDWDATASDIHHRHVSHLYGLYPSGQISLDHTPDIAKAAQRSLEIRGDEATGWGIGWRLNLWARLRDGEHAHHILTLLLGPERTYPNLFDAHPPFQIDGNFGGVSGMTEMVLQSLKGAKGEDEVLLLPALPKAWPTGKITGLRARGALDVDVRWKDGALDSALLMARRAGKWTVRVGGKSAVVELPAGRGATVTLKNGAIAVA
jgi:alpha-L-fucosidase 2